MKKFLVFLLIPLFSFSQEQLTGEKIIDHINEFFSALNIKNYNNTKKKIYSLKSIFTKFSYKPFFIYLTFSDNLKNKEILDKLDELQKKFDELKNESKDSS